MMQCEIAEKLGRSPRSVREKSIMIGLKEKKNIYFTSEEIKFLKENGENIPINIIAKKLHRSAKDVIEKMNRLGIDADLSSVKKTLCWDCKKATNRFLCSWVRDFTPVPGWKARKMQPDGRIKSKENIKQDYLVISCPNFERG